MQVTEHVKELILSRLRSNSLPQIKPVDIANHLGHGKPWVTRLLNGTLKNLSDAQVEKLEELLGIRFEVFTDAGEKITGLAADVDYLIRENPAFAKTISSLVELASTPRVKFTPAYVPTQDMTKLGQEIIRIAFANEDKPGKVAREILKLLS